MAQAKNWCFTSYADEVPFFDSTEVEYCIFGNEKCPETGRWHKQGFVQFKSRKRLSALKKLDPTAHWEHMRGNIEQAIDYCKKDGDYYIQGDYISPGIRDGNEFKIVLDLVKQGKFDEIENSKYLGTYIRYKKTFDTFYKPDVECLIEPCGVWMHGAPGIGKDTAVIEKYKPYIKPHSKWWDGYTGEDVVLWSDFDPDEMKYFYTYLKQWTDRYPFVAETKGGSMKIRPKKFIVTSNYPLDYCVAEEAKRPALRRRFDLVECDLKVVTKRQKFMPNVTLQDLI